jgi:hypothetical protein
MPLLETMTQSELDEARGTICRILGAYERAIITEVCRADGIIDPSKLAEIRDTVATLRGVLRDIASATSTWHKAQ